MYLFLSFIIVIHVTLSFSQTVVNTTDGPVQGRSGGWVTAFTGINYASAPVAKKRFLKPYPVAPWKKIFVADKFGSICMQGNTTMKMMHLPDLQMSEDCLNINVFVPVSDINIENKLPVLVFVHPGHFKYGTGLMLNGSYLAMQMNSVVVSFNYRLGIFGFMSYSSSFAGNLGIYDQILAIKWVKKNIFAFGGNPDNIAVIADTVNAKILQSTPMLKEQFTKLLILGFDIPVPIGEIGVSRSVVEKLCKNRNLTECLYNMNSKTMQEISSKYDSTWTRSYFVPVTDDRVINTERPQLNVDPSQTDILYLDLIGPSYIFRKTSVVFGYEMYPCTMTTFKNIVKMVSNMTSSSYFDLLEAFYFPEDQTADGICSKIIVLLHDFSTYKMLSDINRQSRKTLTFLGLPEPFYLLQSSSVDQMCLFDASRSDCDQDSSFRFLVSVLSSFIQHGFPSTGQNTIWRPYSHHSKNHVTFNGYSSTSGNADNWPLVRLEKLWMHLMPSFSEQPNSEHSKSVTETQKAQKQSIDWGMTNEQLEALLFSLIFVSLFLTIVTMTLVRIVCFVRGKPFTSVPKKTKVATRRQAPASKANVHRLTTTNNGQATPCDHDDVITSSNF